MWKRILTSGGIAGLIVGGELFGVVMLAKGHQSGPGGVLLGYATMLLAFSLIFLAIKQHRDKTQGGVIRFLPAFGMGLAISFLASVLYVASWEAALAIRHLDFAGEYARATIEAQRAKGVSGAALDKIVREMEAFKAQYAVPYIRYGMSFMEIFPVGFLVSLISAALLRNKSFLPAPRS